MNFLARYVIPTPWLLTRNCLHLSQELLSACRVAALPCPPHCKSQVQQVDGEVRGTLRTSKFLLGLSAASSPETPTTASPQKDLSLQEATVKAADWPLTGPWAENLWNCVDFNTWRKNTVMSNVSFLLTGAQQGTWFSHSQSRATSFWVSAQTTQLHPAHPHEVLLTTWKRPKTSYTLQNEPGKARTGFLGPCCLPCPLQVSSSSTVCSKSAWLLTMESLAACLSPVRFYSMTTDWWNSPAVAASPTGLC